MRFDKEIKALLQAIPISQRKNSLKIATCRRAFVAMSLLKENCKDGEGCGGNLIKTFIHTQISYLFIWKMSLSTYFISLIKMSWEVGWLESFRMLWKSMVHKGKKNRAPCSYSVIVMKYILKYVYDKPTEYIVERIEGEGMGLIWTVFEAMNGKPSGMRAH